MIHRDLKPHNVFLTDRDGQPDWVKIVDFGIAKVTGSGNLQETTKLTASGACWERRST